MLVDFSYHPQIHDWVWIYFFLKEENAWDIILELTKVDFFLDFFFFKYCISRDVMQSNFFFPCGQVLVFIKNYVTLSCLQPMHSLCLFIKSH